MPMPMTSRVWLPELLTTASLIVPKSIEPANP